MIDSSRSSMDPAYIDERISVSLPLVGKIAQHLAASLPYRVEIGELETAGTIGLVQAARDYAPGKLDFNMYVRHRIRGAMLDSVRQSTKPQMVQRDLLPKKRARAADSQLLKCDCRSKCA